MIRHDRIADTHEGEVERQRSAWVQFCRGRHRRPPLSRADIQRAAAISFDDTPRATLAAAWAGASTRDRVDLIQRVTRSASDER